MDYERTGMEQNMGIEKESILHIFPEHLRGKFRICVQYASVLQEIRLRAELPVIFVLKGKEFFLQKDGEVGEDVKNACTISGQEVLDILNHICNYSIYAFEDEIRQGFITVPGGHRIGLAGQAVLENGIKMRYLKHVHYMNIRIAHQIRGAAEGVLPFLYKEGRVCNTLILSPPGCGKTTMLRDLIRCISNGSSWGKGCAVSVIDERSEIAGSFQGIPQNDVGMRTDVMDACPKILGMMMVIRSMAPKVLAVDELENDEELELLRQAMASGCRILATLHAENTADMMRKEFMTNAVEKHFFQRYIVLEKRNGIPAVAGIYDERIEAC